MGFSHHELETLQKTILMNPGHLAWTETTAHLVRAAHLKHLLIVRDPRDVLVSFVHYVTRPEHVLSADFLNRKLRPDSGPACRAASQSSSRLSPPLLPLGQNWGLARWNLLAVCGTMRMEKRHGKKTSPPNAESYRP